MPGSRLSRVLLLALLAAPVSAEVFVSTTDVVELRGVRTSMEGPKADTVQRFGRAGWLTGVTSHIVDENGAPADHSGIFCHTILSDGRQSDLRRRWGLLEQPLQMSLSEGLNEVRFPKGFGIAVSSTVAIGVESMLRSEDGKGDGRYRFQLGYEFTPEDPAAAPLKPLHPMIVRIQGFGAEHCGTGGFMAPHGRKTYQARFRVPYPTRVHLITFHGHKYVRGYSLLEQDTGKVLFRADVEDDARGNPLALPVYSSVEGLPLAKGGRYVFQAVLDNPEKDPVETMAILRLYVEAAPAVSVAKQ